MKYFLLILLIPNLAQATMTAQEARDEMDRVSSNLIYKTSKELPNLIDKSIIDVAKEGYCQTDIPTSSVRRSVVFSEQKRLMGLGYKVDLERGRYKDTTNTAIEYITVYWCK